jgi:hypothetical protein
VTVTGSASGTFIGYNRCSYNNLVSTIGDTACAVSSLTNGFQYTPYGFSLPGALDGRATINTQAHAGAAAILVPTNSGTLANKGTAPITVDVAGVVACPTCLASSGAALTKTDDTNVTLTLGGSPTTALVNAASIAAGWTGQLSLARGGTGASLTASNGGIVYSTASAEAILSGTATARQMLQSGATAAPAWSTTTWPATTTVNRLLWSSAANVISDLVTANSSVLITDSSGIPSWAATLPCANRPAITGDVTASAGSCVTAIGATKVTSATLNADVFSTAHNWAGIQTFATPVINGLPTGTGVATANTASTLVARDASGNFTAGVGTFSQLLMAAGAGAFGAGSSATSGQLTTMLLNGGSAAGSYMAWQAGNVTYAYLGDSRAITGAANDDFLIQAQSGDGIHFQVNGTNSDKFAITSGGTIQANGVSAVSCTVGTVSAATMVVTNGIVTHC